MQLAITALGAKNTHFIEAVLMSIDDCKCNVLELRTSHLADASAAYLLVEGNWNQIAKLENTLATLQIKLDIQLTTLRPNPGNKNIEGIPYTLETVSLYRNDVIKDITHFLLCRQIEIEEISASRYPAAYGQNPIFSTRFIITIPAKTRLLTLREEFMDFCDNLNLDAILEPIKR